MDFFNKFTLETPESVELDFTLAGIGNRAFALVIDYFCFWLILIIYLLSTFVFSEVISTVLNSFLPNLENVEMWLTAIFFVIFFFIYVGYFVFFETLWQGQTPGKRRVKIRVIRDDGRPVGLQQATLRALLRPVDDILFLGVLLIVFSKQEKRLGDLVAGTLVIQEEKANNLATFLISKEAKGLVNYLIDKSNLSRLSTEHFAVIREYLQRREGMLKQARHELSRKLAYQVKDIIELQEIPENTTANHFLEAVYLAYQQGIENKE
ncbi:RDD family protein [Aphanothece sacrum]|uniref:Membrane protein n=1 Tax=Aphanothece sacrum FPU1 TaxID=1920663 RepID=A0A401IES8_APHSA|nr:RDD family protein [Aphanothece sacrum]GBF79744.1 membrane protein [Aphanothece sacrum FPU1]GBF85724.1 membrane protein [Aphanothece sacrum FPU3]